MANPMEMMKGALSSVGERLKKVKPKQHSPMEGLGVAGDALKKAAMTGYSTVKSDIKALTTPSTPATSIPKKTIRKKAKEIEEAL